MTQQDLQTKATIGEKLREDAPQFLADVTQKLEVLNTGNDALTTNESFWLRTYLAEMHTGLDLIAPHLKPGMRVLEIGAGIGALGHFLDSHGIDIAGLEPQGGGFDMMAKFGKRMCEVCADISGFTAQDKTCEALNPQTDGQFDLIFSVHVMEHLADPKTAMAAMNSVLKPGGKMVHLCPNYQFPYDPHFFVPIVFWSPRLTKFLFKSKIRKDLDLWGSLNFITSHQVRQMAQDNALGVSFKKGVMAAFFKRLKSDTVFKERHKGLVAKCAGLVARTPLVHVLGALPICMTSPMIFTLNKSQETGD